MYLFSAFTPRSLRLSVIFFLLPSLFCGCSKNQKSHLTIGSKFFTEQVILAELLAQHIEARTGVHVDRKSNLGGTMLCQKALLAGDLDLYVEYTGTALTAVLNESPSADSHDVYNRVRQGYAQRFNLEVTEIETLGVALPDAIVNVVGICTRLRPTFQSRGY